MYEYIKGKLVELTPTYAILETNGIGYFINISINSYSQLSNQENCILYIHQVIREDTNTLFGFFNKNEREIFRYLISVSGIGANTARMMLSSLSPVEIQQAIISSNVTLLKSVKGIGAKSAQRIIIDLKDKLGKVSDSDDIFVSQDNTIKEETLSALMMLGFTKKSIEKVLDKLLISNKDLSVEELIKLSLKQL
ncbi:MAG: Holliday junction branch migration protein RuvA [Bacteroidales bacterium]|nr:Holliday junction branch migration protein RuvA [Bacteroidales bacterium]